MKCCGSSSPLVVLVGAGPGEADLITAAGAYWLARADCVVYDRLVDPSLPARAPDGAELIFVGKAAGRAELSQRRINELLIEKARACGCVVRLKGGDPLIFGRGGEEARALAEAGIPFRIVPGVTAAAAAAACAGIPLTERGLSSAVVMVTGHEDPSKAESAVDFDALSRMDTVVFYMGVGKLASLAERLIAAGRSGETPAAVVERAAMPGQRTITGTLATLADLADRAGVKPPAVVIVGPTVACREKLVWMEKLPLFARTVLVTRPRHQADELRRLLMEHGARVVLSPAVEIRPPEDYSPLDEALGRLGETDWLVLTSVNGVEQVFSRLAAAGRDTRALGGVRVAAIGSATAEALGARGVVPDLVPEPYTTAALAKAMTADGVMADSRVLLARSQQAGEEPAAALRSVGAEVADVVAYRTCHAESLADEAMEALVGGLVDWITFTSASTVDGFCRQASSAGVEGALVGAKLAAIGPVTAEALRGRGLAPAAVAEEHTAAGLVRAMISAESGR